MTNGSMNRGRPRQEPGAQAENYTITARMVRTEDSVAREYVVDGAVVGSAAEVKTLVGGRL